MDKCQIWVIEINLKIRGLKLSRSKKEYIDCKFSKRMTQDNIVATLDGCEILMNNQLSYLNSIIQEGWKINSDVKHKIQN